MLLWRRQTNSFTDTKRLQNKSYFKSASPTRSSGSKSNLYFFNAYEYILFTCFYRCSPLCFSLVSQQENLLHYLNNNDHVKSLHCCSETVAAWLIARFILPLSIARSFYSWTNRSESLFWRHTVIFNGLKVRQTPNDAFRGHVNEGLPCTS